MQNSKNQQEMYDELSYYTLEKRDPEFIHQNIVDAFAAQTAGAGTKPVKITFALAGLYLTLEKGYTGKQVQLAHMEMADKRKVWPSFVLPEKRGDITVSQVLNAEPGPKRDAMIRIWCQSVWDAYREVQPQVRELLDSVLKESY